MAARRGLAGAVPVLLKLDGIFSPNRNASCVRKEELLSVREPPRPYAQAAHADPK